MHEFPVVSTDSQLATTSRRDFVCHDVSALALQRTEALNTNRVSLSLPLSLFHTHTFSLFCELKVFHVHLYAVTS